MSYFELGQQLLAIKHRKFKFQMENVNKQCQAKSEERKVPVSCSSTRSSSVRSRVRVVSLGISSSIPIVVSSLPNQSQARAKQLSKPLVNERISCSVKAVSSSDRKGSSEQGSMCVGGVRYPVVVLLQQADSSVAFIDSVVGSIKEALLECK